MRDRMVRRFLALLAFVAWASPAPAAERLACSLLVDAGSGAVIESRGPDCERRNSPASTFKLALALIGYREGVLADAHHPAWPFKPGYPSWRESWKQTIDPALWQMESVLWYSQELTRRLGAERLQREVDRLAYGNRDLSGDPGRKNGLTRAWLSSSLLISPAEQVAFVRALLTDASAPAGRTRAVVPAFPLPGGGTVHGKTGAGLIRRPDGTLDRSRYFGWFVGWAEIGRRRLAFARLIEDESQETIPAGFRARDAMLAELAAR